MLRKYFVILILLAACSQNVDTSSQEITNNNTGENSTTIQDIKNLGYKSVQFHIPRD